MSPPPRSHSTSASTASSPPYLFPLVDAHTKHRSMRAYSPPVTRQRARAIILGEAAQKDRHGQQEQEQEQGDQAQAQEQAQRARGNSTARSRRRDHLQQRSAPEEELLSDRGGVGAKGAKGGRRGAGSGFSYSREAGTRPVSGEELGLPCAIVAVYWCGVAVEDCGWVPLGLCWRVLFLSVGEKESWLTFRPLFPSTARERERFKLG